jgi:PAS domain S-box-containing protein
MELRRDESPQIAAPPAAAEGAAPSADPDLSDDDDLAMKRAIAAAESFDRSQAQDDAGARGPQDMTPDDAALREAIPARSASEPHQHVDVAAAEEDISVAVSAEALEADHAADAAPAPLLRIVGSPPPHEEPASESAAVAESGADEAPPFDANARDLLDRIPVGVLVSRGNRVLYANRTLLDLLDHPSLASIEAQGGVAAMFKGRAPQSERDGPTGPLLLNGRHGDAIAVDARLQAATWDGGAATMTTFRRAIDVEMGQKLKATELDLRARGSELRELRAVLDTATDGVAIVDEEGRILSLNRGAEALFGFEQNEVAGEQVTILFAPESHTLAADYFEGLKSGGVRSVMNDGRELVGRVRQGGRIPLFVTFGQIAEKPARKYCAVMRDLSPWKKSERDLVDARRAAENASTQKSDFLAKISHEIRTPLNAIIGFAEVMMEERFGAIGNDRYKDYLRDMHASGGHVISLVNDLLDLSKIEAGKLDLAFASVNANEIVRGAVNLMQPQSQRARVVVRTALASKLPPVVADERALKQIVINLLSNAVKFTESGGQVIVSTTITDLGELAIRIRDTGLGMTETELIEAMEPFRQLATSRRNGGTGLGLPLTKALVEANRASLKLSSVKNEGTLAEVVFPPTRVLAE